MAIQGVGRRDAETKVSRFIHGTHRLAITSEAMAELLGLAEPQCRAELDALASRGLLRKESRDSLPPLYCKG